MREAIFKYEKGAKLLSHYKLWKFEMGTYICVDGEKTVRVSSFPVSVTVLHLREQFYHRFSKKSREENKQKLVGAGHLVL